jgi:hypothetical protein
MPNAAVEQLGLQERVTEIFPSELVIPAPCSGMLVCVTRPDDDETRSRLSCIHDRPTAREYAAEMAFMETLACEWDSPVSALAQCVGTRLTLLGMLADADGSRMNREGVEGKSNEPGEVGEAVAELLADARDRAGAAWGDEAEGLSLPNAIGMSGELAALLDAAGIDDECGDFETGPTETPAQIRELDGDWDDEEEDWRAPDEDSLPQEPSEQEEDDFDDEEPN